VKLPDQVDVLVVGGGINGAGIARDAAGRGLSVLLVEQDDLAMHTSSHSSKLIHGGLRYLEYYEFRLVREALIEREVLLAAAPHIVWPLTFVLPHSPEQRPAWMIRLGLFLYDHLGVRRTLPGSRSVDLRQGPLGAALQPRIERGFTYSDCWVDDARLVVLNALGAAARGATILTRTRCAGARREGGLWRAELDGPEGRREVRARALVNATGPWVQRFIQDELGLATRYGVRLVKGSHIVVPKLYEGEHPYILQNDDGRVVFVIPFEHDFSLIGTTDLPFEGEARTVAISAEETAYLCRAVNRYFRRQIAPADAVWSFAGVRPLYDDARANVSAVTRDYVFDLDAAAGRAPLLSIFGGKITTYRKLAEHALAKLAPHLGNVAPRWTATAPLPGGDMPGADFDAYLGGLKSAYPWLPAALALRYARAYGTWTERILRGASGLAGLGEHLGEGLYAAEVDYLMRHEWANSPEDLLWRRSKLGLHLGRETQARLAQWMARVEAPAGRAPAGRTAVV